MEVAVQCRSLGVGKQQLVWFGEQEVKDPVLRALNKEVWT